MKLPKISLIANVRDDLCIGVNGDLLYKIKEDLAFFKTITTTPNKHLFPNVVVMGRKTYYSIDAGYRPLPGRINVVLTRDPELLKYSRKVDVRKKQIGPFFMTFQEFENIFLHSDKNDIFVIGGGEIYKLFLEHPVYFPTKVYLTVVTPKVKSPRQVHFGESSTTWFPALDYNYKLIGYTSKTTVEKYNANYRTLFYRRTSETSQEYNYLNLMKNILDNGNVRDDRTGTGTVSLFGTQMRFDISESIPLLTTKRVPFRIILEELLWFCRGETDAKILQRKNIKIWDGNTSREFLDSRGLQNYPEGVLGPQYGFLWRHFGAKYSPYFADKSKMDPEIEIGGFDQLKYVEDLLENDPFSRRIMISAWNPAQISEQTLPSCHHNIQFYVTESEGQKFLSCMFVMRSSDFDTASCYNSVGYTLLTYILAARHNMKPKELIYIAGDTHIYSNHFDQVKKQLPRIPRPFPKVKLSDEIKTKDWKDMSVDDIDLIGYFPHPQIKIKMAI